MLTLHTQFQRQRGRDVDRRRCTDRHTDQHGQREAFQNRATEEEQHQDNHQGRSGCNQRTVQRLRQ
ncbi:hypothetical protein D3C87_2191130 [compost metagenome]